MAVKADGPVVDVADRRWLLHHHVINGDPVVPEVAADSSHAFRPAAAGRYHHHSIAGQPDMLDGLPDARDRRVRDFRRPFPAGGVAVNDPIEIEDHRGLPGSARRPHPPVSAVGAFDATDVDFMPAHQVGVLFGIYNLRLIHPPFPPSSRRPHRWRRQPLPSGRPWPRRCGC